MKCCFPCVSTTSKNQVMLIYVHFRVSGTDFWELQRWARKHQKQMNVTALCHSETPQDWVRGRSFKWWFTAPWRPTVETTYCWNMFLNEPKSETATAASHGTKIMSIQGPHSNFFQSAFCWLVWKQRSRSKKKKLQHYFVAVLTIKARSVFNRYFH